MPMPMPARLARVGPVLLLLLMLGGCGSLRSLPMLAPTLFDMEQARAGLYVEPAMSAAQRHALVAQIDAGRTQVERLWGTITTAPYVVACVTAQCAHRFGSFGERASAFGDSAIRLSPDGLGAALVAHEWSHVELYRRVGGWWRVSAIPRWFDEGLAVVVADEARHSADNWREIQRLALVTPALDDLVSRADWLRALRRYGETLGDDPRNRRLVYGKAGHEVRTWLACARPGALHELIAAVRSGASFEAVYRELGPDCPRPSERVEPREAATVSGR